MSKYPKPTFEFTIDRSRWACGYNNEIRHDGSAMLDDEFQCCLGFLASACGTPNRDLHTHGGPMPGMYLPACFGITKHAGASLAQIEAININDGVDLSPKTVESKLTDLFAQAGIKVHFKGEYL